MIDKTRTTVALLWTLIAAVGLNWAVRNWLLARKDAAYQKKHGLNGAREVIVRGTLRREMFRVVIHVLFILVGILSILGLTGNYVTWAFRVAFLTAALLLAVVSIMESRDRDELDFEIREREKRL